MDKGLERHFTGRTIVWYTAPSVMMLVTISLYMIVDGFFVSYFLGTTALAAVNIVYPVSGMFLAVTIMLSLGASAIVSKRLGEKDTKGSNGGFSFIFAVGMTFSVTVSVLINIFLKPVVGLLGAEPVHMGLCLAYGRALFWFSPMFFMQMYFQTFFGVAGRPILGLATTVTSGVSNLIMDYVFLGIFKWGMAGAGLATGLGYSIGATVGLIYFIANKKGLHLKKSFKYDWKMLLKSCTNGSSEMIGNMANALTTLLFNLAMVKYYGSDGVAAITIVLYFQFIFSSIHMGYAVGVSPIIAFKYGEKNLPQLRHIMKISLILVIGNSLIIYVLSKLSAGYLTGIFARGESSVYNLAMSGFVIFGLSFLFNGINIFASAWFTALSNGVISAVISIMRTFVFILIAIVTLPRIFGAFGIWMAMPLAELLGMGVSIFFLVKYASVYGYGKSVRGKEPKV